MPEEANRVPEIEIAHKNISLANIYRIEVIKYCILASTSLLAFTVSFRPALVEPVNNVLLWVSWFSLGFSALGGVGNMYGWERFYMTYRDYDLRDMKAEGKAARKPIQLLRRFCMMLQFAGLAAGVLSVALYFSQNIDKLKP